LNAIVSSGFYITQVEEMKAVDASFWYTYNQIITKSKNELSKLNDWKANPMAALPACLSNCMQKH
jgi:hypothetical protein